MKHRGYQRNFSNILPFRSCCIQLGRKELRNADPDRHVFLKYFIRLIMSINRVQTCQLIQFKMHFVVRWGGKLKLPILRNR